MKIYKLQRTLTFAAGAITYTVGDYTDKAAADRAMKRNNDNFALFIRSALVGLEWGGRDTMPLANFINDLGVFGIAHTVQEFETLGEIEIVKPPDIVLAEN